MSRTLICQMIPDKITHKHDISQALTNFNITLIKTECFDQIISLVPVNIYCSVLTETVDDSVHYIQLKRRKNNKISKLLNNLKENIQIVSLVKSSSKIWFSNVNAQTLISCIILKYIYRKKIYNILTDYTPTTNKLSIQYLLKNLIDNLSGIISLSSRTDLCHSNMSYIAGIIPTERIEINTFSNLNRNTFLFSGALEKITGIDLALNVFSKLPHLKLIISGRGNEVESVIKYAEKYPNIEYLGFLEYQSYLKTLNNISFCLSLRNPNYPENNNNFPSKILEYFASNKIVISTVEYPELDNFQYFFCNFNEEKLTILLNEVIKIEDEKLFEFTNNINALASEFSISVWQDKIQKLESDS